LERLYRSYCNDRDKGRIIAYTKAISFIKSLRFKIINAEQLVDMPTVGEGIKKKIVEILQTGKLSKADNLDALESNQIQNVFTQVWGIGASKAASLYLAGLRTLEDLEKR
jgi:DNA polymerase lambda